MIVSELIEKLKSFPGDMRVVVTGYEGGLTDPDIDSPIKFLVHLNCQKAGYEGEHKVCGASRTREKNNAVEDWECWECGEHKLTPTYAVLIER